MSVLFVCGAFALVSSLCETLMLRMSEDSKTAIFCLSQSVCVCVCPAVGVGAAHGPRSCIMVLFQEELDVRVFTGRDVSRPVCVSVYSGGSIPSPYGQCVI